MIVIDFVRILAFMHQRDSSNLILRILCIYVDLVFGNERSVKAVRFLGADIQVILQLDAIDSVVVESY